MQTTKYWDETWPRQTCIENSLYFFFLSDNVKVHFPEEQLSKHNLEIVIQPDSVSPQVGVHLGFLQLHHHYHVTFSIKDDLGQEVTFDPLENLHIKFMEVKPSENGIISNFLYDIMKKL